MKRLLLTITLICLSLVLLGCTVNANNVNSEQPSNTEMPSTTTIVSYGSYEHYESLSNYINHIVDNIIIGTVTQSPSVKRINATALGYVSGSEESWNNVTSYRIQVDDVLMGSYTPGDIISVDQNGGTSQGFTEYTVDEPFLEKGHTYLLLLNTPKEHKDKPYYKVMLTNPPDGYPEVINGRLVPNRLSRFFATPEQKRMGFSASIEDLAGVGMRLEDAKKMIQDAIEEAAHKE